MAYVDLPDFINDLENKGLLHRIKVEVDPVLEITEIVDRVVKKGGPALYFERVKGSVHPLVINLFGSARRMALALGTENLEQLESLFQEYRDIFRDVPGSFKERLRLFSKAARVMKYLPRIIENAPCQEVVEEKPDLTALPVLQCWPEDGGKFITLPLVFTKDADTGKRNCGMYRMHVYDGKTTGLHWHFSKDGSRHFRNHQAKGGIMEVAVALGSDPATIYAATAPLPPDIDEMVLASILRQSPVEMTKCRTVDLEVPAHAEFVLEGYVDTNEKRREGPFGDHTGVYSPVDEYPVFHLTCLTRKRRAVYPSLIVGRPPMEDYYLGKATERLFLPQLKFLIPEIKDLNLPPEGVFHNCAVVSIKKEYPGQAKKVLHGLWGLSQLACTKLIIVVDHDVNIQDMAMVWWRVFSSIDAQRDLVVVQGPLDALDHSSPWPHYGAKLGIDATKKWPEEGHARPWPEDLSMLPDIRKMVTRRWSSYGLPEL